MVSEQSDAWLQHEITCMQTVFAVCQGEPKHSPLAFLFCYFKLRLQYRRFRFECGTDFDSDAWR